VELIQETCDEYQDLLDSFKKNPKEYFEATIKFN
jgi:hypothetical protein